MSHSLQKLILSGVFVAVSATSAFAVPAKPGLLTMTQSDGSTLKVQLMGDERHHFYLSEDGYMLVEDKGDFYYADIDATGITVKSGIRAVPASQRSAEAVEYLSKVDMSHVCSVMTSRADAMHRSPLLSAPMHSASGSTNIDKGLFPDANFPVHGEQKAIVILVEYSDVKFTLEDPVDYFTRMLNEEGFSDYGGTGSATDFFTECSGGKFLPEFDVYGPVTLPQKQSYYGGNDWSGNDQHPEQMVVHACNILDPDVDFTQYDRDGDGYIDNVFVFYAGRGEASGGAANTVWPHSWNVTAGDATPHFYDGVQVDRYACSNEWEGSRPDGIGTFVHEFSHVMGLPDLYATSYTGAFTPGAWSAMDYGPYNNNGCTPPYYGAFERYALGWMEPKTIDGPLTASLMPISENIAGIIRTPNDNEFFLLENRQQQGWDKYIPGHGMLIWHVDFDGGVWATNAVNNDAAHQRVDLVEADGVATASTRAGDSFPGTASVTSHTLKAWGGSIDALPLTDIAETAGVVTFKVAGGKASQTIEKALAATNIGAHSFTANWAARQGVNYMLTVTDDNGVVDGYDNLSVGAVSSYLVDGLAADTEYSYTVTGIEGLQMSEPSAAISVTTGNTPLAELSVTALEAEEVTADSFTACWQAVAGATGYNLTVFTREAAGPLTDVMAFDNGLGDVTANGWSTTSTMIYNMAGMAGTSAPSLRLGHAGSITSTTYADGISALSLWHRGSGTADNARIRIEAHTADGWQTVDESPVSTEKGGKVLRYADVPTRTDAVRITAVCESGNIAIDDITVSHGTAYTATPVSPYDPVPVGDATRYAVSGLRPGITYYYTVTATDGKGNLSKPSRHIEVSILSGISSVATDTATIRAEGLTVYVSGMAHDTTVRLCDTMGRTVATSKGDSQLTATIPGLYILIVGNDATKVLLR